MEIREYTAYRESEIMNLYRDAGWTAYTNDPESLRRGFEASLVTYAAYVGEELAGILRAVGDGSTVVFIQDILVLSRYRRKGIGTALVRAVLERFPNVRQIQLTADDTPGARAFYASLGFRELSRIGCTGFIRMGN
ncbi:MAG: GNAT family N-acetyltransferase [Clostridia bacterium]|nr:GNAT family N-acetyltransferase [Clostridia bacterium]